MVGRRVVGAAVATARWIAGIELGLRRNGRCLGIHPHEERVAERAHVARHVDDLGAITIDAIRRDWAGVGDVHRAVALGVGHADGRSAHGRVAAIQRDLAARRVVEAHLELKVAVQLGDLVVVLQTGIADRQQIGQERLIGCDAYRG